jgi:hypothetical protein
MRRTGFLLASLLVLNACAITRHTAPPPGLAPVPADSVVMIAPGTPPSDDAATVAVFTPSGELDRLSDTDLLRFYVPQAGRRGANHVSLLQVNGRRMVRAYYLRIPLPIAVVPTDSVKPQPPSGGSAASPSTGGSVHVRGYYRRDGTYVRPHTRSRPGSRRRN